MSEFEDVLSSATEEVLETMFYTGAFGPGTEGEGPYFSAGVSFKGSHNGVLDVAVPEITAMSLAASFLGETIDSVPAEQVPTVIGELANVLCGVVLGKIAEGGEFVIAPPEIARKDLAALARNLAARQVFELEEGTLSVGLTIDAMPVNG
ncbi:MAG: chemotaxis protein CheX [Ignavibacteriota bacterium]